ncbi:MAG: hypothetical protein ACQEQH_03520 [Bacillota bacterium]
MIDKRTDAALKVQKVLTENGCKIKTRLGLHETSSCEEEGLIFLNIDSSKKEADVLINELNKIKRVKAKLVEISLKN